MLAASACGGDTDPQYPGWTGGAGDPAGAGVPPGYEPTGDGMPNDFSPLDPPDVNANTNPYQGPDPMVPPPTAGPPIEYGSS